MELSLPGTCPNAEAKIPAVTWQWGKTASPNGRRQTRLGNAERETAGPALGSNSRPEQRARSEEESKAAVSPSWLPGWGGLQRGWPSSRRVSKFLTSEAEIETEIATDTGLATAAKLSNSEALSPVSVPVTSSSDPQRTRHGFPPAPPQSSSLWTGGKRDVSHVLPD